MGTLFKVIKSLFLYPIGILFSITAYTLLLVLYVLQFIPCILYRNLVHILGKCVYPGARMLPGYDNVLAAGSVYKSKDLYISANLIFEGKLELEKFAEELDDKLINKRLENGQLHYPELQHYVQPFMGHNFYIKEEEFHWKNHVKLHEEGNNDTIDKKQYHKIRKEHINKLFPEKMSPWEILIIQNYKKDGKEGKEYSVLQFKFHHCLADGYAIIRALFGPFGKVTPLNVPQFGNTFLSKLAANFAAFVYFLKIPGEVLFNLVYSPKKAFDLNSWQRSIKKRDMDAILWSPEPVNVEIIKEISKANKVSISAVLLAATSGAFRRFMEAKGIKSPENIRVEFTHNIPNPKDRLTNNSSGVFFPIPISDLQKNPTERLRKTNSNLVNALGVSFKLFSPILLRIVKYWPGSFRLSNFGPEIDKSFVTMGFISLPLPSFDVEWAGCNLVETYQNIEFVSLSIALLVKILKYKSNFFVTFAIKKSLLASEEEIYEIEKHLLEELNYLKCNTINV